MLQSPNAPGAQRVAVLEEASRIITGDRSESYGDFGAQMEGIAQAYNGIKFEEGGPRLSGSDISLILQLLKLRRRQTSHDIDSSVDLCGYAALDAEHFTPAAPAKV